MENQPRFQLTKQDPYLRPFEQHYLEVRRRVDQRLADFQPEGGLDLLSQSYKKYGIHRRGEVFVYQEWAPEARSISLFGDFNGWRRGEFCCTKDAFGLWTCELDAEILPMSALKAEVELADGRTEDRIPAWINFTRQNPDKSFDGVYVPLGDYEWQHPRPSWPSEAGLSIYECHIGMSGPEEKVHSYSYFRQEVLPRVKAAGYRAIQIMGVIQHPYYGSFGYHCSSYFSVSSRFGTPWEFKELVDAAHGLGLKVVIDLVHSHAAKNVNEGLNLWDGTDYQYFHGGTRGLHPLWDSRVFDYSKYEVLRFLLSNIRFWLEEYRTDGFRFDGVTSMLYTHHGHNYVFTGDYREYFGDALDYDALAYLAIANQLAKQINPDAILIAEDVSGFPGLCRPLQEGGLGFGYRLAMATPDMWIRLLKEARDEDWNLGEVVHRLTNTRPLQKCIAYAESHDQALVGDKTLSMWLFGEEIYQGMSLLGEESPRVFRGMALHKMIRLLTLTLGSQGYLNFMGNEFGHPEWIDFPRQGNDWSYKYCRRQWQLADRSDLRYHQLGEFDRALLTLDQQFHLLTASHQYVRNCHEQDKVLVYERGPLLFVLNWHPTRSYEDYALLCRPSCRARFLLTTDDQRWGGHQRVTHQDYELQEGSGGLSRFSLYVPSRCAIVFLLEQDS